MILLLFIFFLTLVFCGLFYLTGLSLWFYFLWVPLSIILSILVVVLIIELMFVFMVKREPTGKFRHWLLHQATWIILFLSNIKVEVVGKENIPNDTFVCYANHKSNFDPVILYYSFNRVCGAIGKQSLFKVGIMRQLSEVFGAVPLNRDNDREAAKSMIKAIKLVKSGLSMIIFPEGGIKSKETEEMVNLRAGAYKLVTKSGAKLLPVSIIGNTKMKKRSVFRKAKVKVIVHKPMNEQDYKDMNTTQLGTIVQNIINEDIHEASV